MKKEIVYAYIRNKNKILMVNNIGIGWTFPGGTVEKFETKESAIIREVFEETGLSINIEKVLDISESVIDGIKYEFTTYFVNIVEGEIKNTDIEILEIKWIQVNIAKSMKSKFPIYSNELSIFKLEKEIELNEL